MAASPTQRSMERLRKEGWAVERTEKWNHVTKTRQDLFGFIDLVAIRPGRTLAVQATSSSNAAARRDKIQEHVNFPAILDAKWEVEVHGWYKNAAGRWICNIYPMTHDHVATQELPP